MESIRLQRLWTQCAGRSRQALDEWGELVGRWSEPHRAYHNLEHLLLMLELLDQQRAAPATMFAAWYHDAVYDPTSATNEADSAKLASEALPRLGHAHLTDRVCELIMLTARHGTAPDMEAALLLDADLAILGQPPAIYLRYVAGVRAEYAHLTDAEFTSGRTAVLHDLLAHERLYQHPELSYLEEPARTNLAAEVQVYADRSST